MPKFTRYILIFVVLIGLFSNLLTNNRPLWCQVNGENWWPAFSLDREPELMVYESENSWVTIPSQQRLMPPNPYSADLYSSDRKLPPFSGGLSGWHWLGTDENGRDVLAGIISGTRTAMITGLLAMLVSLFFGGALGSIAGYWGDSGFKSRLGALITLFLGLLVAVFYIFLSANSVFEEQGLSFFQAFLLLLGVLFASVVLGQLLSRIPFLDKKITLPLDLIVMRLAEIFEATPVLVLLLVLGSMLPHRTLNNMVALIGFLSWPGTARLLRSELLRIRQMEYIRSARYLGIPEWQILWRHTLPNAIRPVTVAFAAGAASAVLLEAGLSFLGMSSSDITIVTWGKMLQTARENIQLWWVWVPPGIMICLIVIALFEWGEKINK